MKMNKKGNATAVVIILAILVLALGLGSGKLNFNQGAVTNNAGGTNVGGTTISTIEPTVLMLGIDKYDSSASTTGTAITYQINDGAIKSDADGSITAVLNDKITVLWGDANTSKYTPRVSSSIVTKNGVNDFTYLGLVQNKTLTIQCFNEEGNPIDDAGENETISTGEAPTLKCELRSGAKSGFPLGGVLTAELSGTAYKENEVSITGLGSMSREGIYGDPISQTLGAYTVSAVANKVVGVEVAGFEGAVVKTFYIYLPAESDQNPSNTQDVTLQFHPAGGYNEEDVVGGALRMGMTDLDNTYVMSVAGTETIQVD